jgi:hypothetical protein
MITVKIDIPRGTRLLPKYIPPDGDLTDWAEGGFNDGQLTFLKSRKWNFYLDFEPVEMKTYLEATLKNEREVFLACVLFGNVTII